MRGHIWRSRWLAGAVSTVAMTGMVVGGGARAFGYGAADQPVAQVELSGNCDNPNFVLCAPRPDGVGTGGIWAWAELDSTGPNATSGTMDATVADCGHLVGGGGPGNAGGHGGPDPYGTWTKITSLGQAPPDAFPFFDASKSYPSYYVLDFFPGSGPDDFVVIVPTTTGHYNQHPAPAVSIQATVAP